MTGNPRGNELHCAIASNLCNPSEHTMKHTELTNRENSLESATLAKRSAVRRIKCMFAHNYVSNHNNNL